MKTGIFSIAAVSLLTLAAAQPRGHREHKRLHAQQRDLKVVTEVDWVTMTAPEVIVYVDQNGNPMYTSYANGQTPVTSSTAAPSSTAAASAVVNVVVASSSSAAAVVVAAPSSSAAVVVVAAPSSTAAAASSSAAKTSSTAAAAAASSSAASTSGNTVPGYSITYSPYTANGGCKTQAQVNADFAKLTSAYSMVRIYGVDCNQVVTVGSAAKAAGMKLFAGIYDITQISSAVSTIAVSGYMDIIHTVSVGNELVNSGTATVAQVVSAIGTARTALKAAGYTGKVVTVDTAGVFMVNPALCQASDYAAANAHAFFNSLTTAAQAGTFVLGQAQAVSKACGGMETVITETGWPSQGSANGAAVPSAADQATAIAALKASFSSNIVLFNAFNDSWKADSAYTYGAEKYWGIYGSSSS